ncbi:MAG: hypothetical protein JWP18_847 [Solirubrobacterales bacterium]|nr:hypothetical protein [Solirubrobacterales bacterium]
MLATFGRVTSFDLAYQQWQAGDQLRRQVEGAKSLAVERVCDVILSELRRRLGSTFTTDELVDLYDQGTSWCLETAVSTAPGAPWAWDERLVADASFFRYVREAQDFAGGRRIQEIEQDA